METNNVNNILWTVTGLDTEGYPDAYNVWAKSPEEAELIAAYLGLETIWESYPFEDNLIGLDDIPDEEEEK